LKRRYQITAKATPITGRAEIDPFRNLEGVLPGDDKGSFIVNPYNCRRFVYFFHLKTMNLSIDWKTKFFACQQRQQL
jgi:hypothetical protein